MQEEILSAPGGPHLSYYLVYWLLSAMAVLITSKIVSGFQIKGFGSALAAALVISLANTFIKPILLILTLPINLITLGLFTLVINGALIKMSAALIKGFEVGSWMSAIFGALLLSLVNVALHWIGMLQWSTPWP